MSSEASPTIITAHFHGEPRKLSVVLDALAAQEGNDGDEGNAMQAAADYIRSRTRASAQEMNR